MKNVAMTPSPKRRSIFSDTVTVYRKHSVQERCLQFVLPDKREFIMKVDAVWVWTDRVLIGGCTSEPSTFQVCLGTEWCTPTLHVRPKVANSETSIPEACRPEAPFPFSLEVPVRPEMDTQNILISVAVSNLSFQQAFPLCADAPETWRQNAHYLAPILAGIAGTQTLFSPEWHFTKALLAESPLPCPAAAGAIDVAVHSAWTDSAVVTGWFSALPDAQVWIEHDNGKMWPTRDAWRYFRDDVQAAVGDKYTIDCKQGFVTRIDDIPAWGSIHLKSIHAGQCSSACHTLSSLAVESCGYDVVALARKAFLPTIALEEFAQAAEAVFTPLLTECCAALVQKWDALPVERHCFGPEPVAPLVSIIVPLYGRIDFVAYQMAAFSTDSWIKEYAEIVYVVDDPNLISELISCSEHIHHLYNMPFQWLWGHTNRGYSGANNLGAAWARAETLIFLNSDVFPNSSGWAQHLHNSLTASDRIGAVGARLLRPDGSLQHAGMRFKHAWELGVWINDHPYAGCSPMLDPHQQSTDVQAVTGACLAIRKQQLSRLGGWDTSYLIGDFEDSDLCMQLRAQGLNILYAPEVCLTHLERQSYSLWGEGDFRQRVTLSNAVRHHQKWGNQILQRQGEQA